MTRPTTHRLLSTVLASAFALSALTFQTAQAAAGNALAASFVNMASAATASTTDHPLFSNAVNDLQAQSDAALSELSLKERALQAEQGNRTVEVRVYRVTPDTMDLLVDQKLLVRVGHFAVASTTTAFSYTREVNTDPKTGKVVFTTSTLKMGPEVGVVWFARGSAGPAVQVAAVDSGILGWSTSDSNVAGLYIDTPRTWIQDTRKTLSLDGHVHMVMSVMVDLGVRITRPTYDAFVVGTPESFARFNTGILARAVLAGRDLN